MEKKLNITSINLNANIRFSEIPKDAFNPRKFKQKNIKWILNNIKNITISENITAIYDYAFSNMEGLQKVSLPSRLTILGTGVFNNCIILKSTNIPFYFTMNGVFCGDNIFYNFPSVKIELPKNGANLESKLGCNPNQISCKEYHILECDRNDLISQLHNSGNIDDIYNKLSLLDLKCLSYDDIKCISDFVQITGVSQRMRENQITSKDCYIIKSIEKLIDITPVLEQELIVFRGVNDSFFTLSIETI